MKKIILTKAALAASVVSLTMFSSLANANSYKFYAGAGIDYSKYGINKEFRQNVSNIKNKGFGVLAPVVGMTFHENLGVEAGYLFAKKFKYNNAALSSTFKVRNMYLDLVGFMPIQAGQFDLIGGLGLGKLIVKKDENLPASTKIKNNFGWRVKFGAQYNVHTNVALRALATYQSSKVKAAAGGLETKLFKGLQSIGLSAVYIF